MELFYTIGYFVLTVALFTLAGATAFLALIVNRNRK
tara:strand:+ start:397 stop:504 length:108 start_codon:yes stop_codon:yes gene_type:complete